jgi:hypothetical protein
MQWIDAPTIWRITGFSNNIYLKIKGFKTERSVPYSRVFLSQSGSQACPQASNPNGSSTEWLGWVNQRGPVAVM